MAVRLLAKLFSVVALVVFVSALNINEYPTDGVVAGRSYTITYNPADNTPTTFVLRQGPSSNLGTVATLTTTATGGSFVWTVPDNLESSSDYALEIRQGDESNYSGQFGITGGSSNDVQTSIASVVAPRPSPTPTPNPAPTPSPAQSPTPETSSDSNDSPSSQTGRVTSQTETSTTASRNNQIASTGSPILSGTGSSLSTGTTPGSSSSVTPGPALPKSHDGLSTGAKAGIGVGVTIAILALGFGAFFLGMSVRKKGRNTTGEEGGLESDKPELGGKGIYTHTAELESGYRGTSAPPPIATAAPPAAVAELHQPPNTYTSPGRTELNAQPVPLEIDSRYAAQELHGDNRQGSPVSPISDNGYPQLTRKDTYNDPQILQNPWAQEDRPHHRT